MPLTATRARRAPSSDYSETEEAFSDRLDEEIIEIERIKKAMLKEAQMERKKITSNFAPRQ